MQTLRKAAVAGLGIALLTSGMTRPAVHADLLVPVLAPYRRTGQGLSVLYPGRRQLPLAVSMFIDFVAEKPSDLEALPDAFRA